MDLTSIAGTGAAAAADGPGDIVDISFAVALLQIETLDAEIGTRLGALEQINELRKAYSGRIEELRRMSDELTGGRAWVNLDETRREDFSWSGAENDGAGGVATAGEGSFGASGGATYRIVDADGNVRTIDIMLEPSGDGHGAPTRGGGWMETPGGDDLPTGLATLRGDLAGDWSAETVSESILIRLSQFTEATLPEAEAWAREHGGTIQVQINQAQLDNEVERLQDRMDNLGADGEMGMLSLNRLLSRRSQVLQLTSNIMSSVHQTAMGIIANIKV
jgi:hypothetical protein